MMSDSTVLKRGRNTAWQTVGDKVVVVTPKTRKIHILDGTGGRIWECLEKPTDIGCIVRTLCDEYDAEPERVKEDVEQFAGELVNKQVIEVEE